MKEKQYSMDITALGECLVDFVEKEKQTGTLTFSGNAGGAPANVLASAARFGKKCAFIGKAGNDSFGHYLKNCYENEGIDVSSMILSSAEPTTLAFVTLDESGDRSFSFYRNDTADCMLSCNEVNFELISSSRIFHFGSVSMTHQISREATLEGAKHARQSGAIVSFDPNFRGNLWNDADEAKKLISDAMYLSDIVKLSKEELEMLIPDLNDYEKGCRSVIDNFGCKVVAITLGKDGAFASCKNGVSAFCPGYAVDTIDTTGAGDAFLGAFLSEYLDINKNMENLDENDLMHMLRNANAFAALSTTKYGAIPSFPPKEEIEKLLGSKI